AGRIGQQRRDAIRASVGSGGAAAVDQIPVPVHFRPAVRRLLAGRDGWSGFNSGCKLPALAIIAPPPIDVEGAGEAAVVQQSLAA
ncbi:MAG TPA: hypothetical protein VK217_09240, partial [Acidimicrobiales bacterium]|nr:hypothetical protein [Acidimicrobiales bacterium]